MKDDLNASPWDKKFEAGPFVTFGGTRNSKLAPLSLLSTTPIRMALITFSKARMCCVA